MKEKEDFTASLAFLLDGYKINPNHKETNHTLAMVYFETGERDDALRHFSFLLVNYPELASEIKPYLDALE